MNCRLVNGPDVSPLGGRRRAPSDQHLVLHFAPERVAVSSQRTRAPASDIQWSSTSPAPSDTDKPADHPTHPEHPTRSADHCAPCTPEASHRSLVAAEQPDRCGQDGDLQWPAHRELGDAGGGHRRVLVPLAVAPGQVDRRLHRHPDDTGQQKRASGSEGGLHGRRNRIARVGGFRPRTRLHRAPRANAAGVDGSRVDGRGRAGRGHSDHA
jgi:hypothetical protein